jgi:F-type H+-transporting ATPase subunit delta
MPHAGAGRRYAEAAFELATRDNAVDAWRRDLAFAAELARDQRVAAAADSPAVPVAERRHLVRRLLASRVSPLALNLALLLAERGRFAVLPDVTSEYDALVRKSRGIVAAAVTTPAPLSGEELAAVKKRVEQLAGAHVELSTAIDPALLGGIRVQIGDLQIDASVSGRLERLRARLVQGAS